MGSSINWKEVCQFVRANFSLLVLTIPFVLNLLQVKVSFLANDYETYLWILFLIYGAVTYGYSCDHIHDLHMFVLLFTVQLHSSIFFQKQTIFKLTPFQKTVMVIYLIIISMFMNIMIRQYKGKKSRINDNKLLFFTNQCSGTVFAQLLFIQIGTWKMSNYGLIAEQYPFDLATYIVFNLLSVFGFFVGLFLLFQMEKYKDSYYDLQKYWFFFTSLFAFLCLIILEWSITTIYELYTLICTFFFYFIFIVGEQSKTWFLILCLFTGLTQIVIQIKYQADFNDAFIHICASVNVCFFTRSLGWLVAKIYTYFFGQMTEQQKQMIGMCFDM